MIKKLEIINNRGLKLSVILTKPYQVHILAVIILLQGFLGKKEGSKINFLSEYLVKMGFATIRFDYCGYGESEGDTFKEYLVTHILDDIKCVLDFIKTKEKIDFSRIGVWGQSMGGMLAIIFAAQNTYVKAVCAISAPAQITVGDDLEKITDEWRKRGFIERQNSNGELIKISYDFVRDARKWNAESLVSSIKAPILIILGTNDDTVDPNITREIFEAAIEPKELIELEGMPHDYKEKPEFINKINKISGDFFRKQLSN